MSFSNRLHHAAIGGWLGAAVLVPCCASGQESPQQEEPAASTQAPSQPPVVTLDTAPLRSIFDDAVKVYRDEKAADAGNEERKERRDQADLLAQQEMAYWAWLMAVLTGIQIPLGTITLGLLYFTFREARKTTRAAIKAAEAADLSAKAAIGIELPIIRCTQNPFLINVTEPPSEEHPFRGGMGTNNPGRYTVISSLSFGNHGRTPAFPMMLDVGWKVVTDQLPPEPVYNQTVQSSATAIINPNDSFEAAARACIELSEDERKRMREKAATLWLYISLHYRDFLNMPHEARFYWRYSHSHGFIGGTKQNAAYTKHT